MANVWEWLAGVVPFAGLVAWFQKTKVDRNECRRIHESLNAFLNQRNQELENRLSEMHKDIREIRDWIRRNGKGSLIS